MIWILEGLLFLSLLAACYCFVSWMDARGIREIRVYSEEFLATEENAVRCRALPDSESRKWADRVELSLYYSGIRSRFPFLSVKFWVLLQCFLALWVWILLGAVRGLLAAFAGALAVPAAFAVFISILRTVRFRRTQEHLLEVINLAEGFSATEEDPVSILLLCGAYIGGPIGQALQSAKRLRDRGMGSRRVLEEMKLLLEHPKWQEFIHNLNVCSMYNCDFVYVLQSSRKSTQRYLTFEREKQGVKRTARVEMVLIIILSAVMLKAMSNPMDISLTWLLWGSLPGKVCTVYLAVILLIFVWCLSGSGQRGAI
ncbi:MAG: hypothetical protein LUI10_08285 [Lachnospiraceae bacterium]|nr:hypothetical protein [Lachnospiraceae bacterium]